MLLVFNWKLNPQSFKQAERLLAAAVTAGKKANRSVIVICPPFEYLFKFLALKPSSWFKSKNLFFGAQDCFWEDFGSYTGEVSPLGLKTSGVEYVILGHSERRGHLNETTAMINKKLLAALRFELKPVLCLGEEKKTHLRGRKAVNSFLARQLQEALTGIERLSQPQKHNLIIAYEPIWAISDNSGNCADDPVEVGATVRFLKQQLVQHYSLTKTKVLYGGSVNSQNLGGFLNDPEIDGFLVGQASLGQLELRKIIEIVG